MTKTRLLSTRRAVLSAVLAGCSLLALAGAPGVQAAPLPTLSLSLSANAVTVSGSTVSGAVNVVTTAAKALKEPSPILVRLNPGKTAADLSALINSPAISDPNNVSKVGAIVFDAEGRSGGTSEAQTELQPGNYVALNIEGEKPKSPPPFAPFTVTASPSPAALPAPGAVVSTIDFGFKSPSTLKVGEIVRFENAGFLVHMDIAFPGRSRKSALRAAAFLRAGKEKAASKLITGPPVSFFGPMSSGGMQQETLGAAPGWYVMACFMDTQDHRQHTLLGMEKVIHIVK